VIVLSRRQNHRRKLTERATQMSSIKVNRLALIKALEEARTRLLDQSKGLEKEWADYDKAVEAWAVKVIKQSKDFKAANYGNAVEVYAPAGLKRPVQPTDNRPREKRYYYDFGKRGEYTTLSDVTARKVAEIENTIKLLKISSEDSVSATAYKSVAQYL
jgi:hypothetical protein